MYFKLFKHNFTMYHEDEWPRHGSDLGKTDWEKWRPSTYADGYILSGRVNNHVLYTSHPYLYFKIPAPLDSYGSGDLLSQRSPKS